MNFVVVFLITLAVCNHTLSGQNQWEEKATLPATRDRAVAFNLGNYGFVGTGSSGTGDGLLNDFWRYDPINDSWTRIDSMPTLKRRSAFCFAINNCGYVGGGVDENISPESEFWEYNLDQEKWTRKANFPRLTSGNEVLTGFSIEGKGYLFATYNIPNFYMYNPQTNTWTARAQFPGEVKLEHKGFSIGGKGYIGSGWGNNRLTKEFWQYDPKTNSWTRKADFPSPRLSAIGFSIGNRGYFGLGQNSRENLDDFWEYNSEEDSWIKINGPGFYSWYAVGMSICNKGYIGTGIQLDNGPNFWEFTPKPSSIEDIDPTSRIEIYPNPANNIINLDLDIQQIMAIGVYNSIGQKTLTINPLARIIDVSELKPGVYFLRIRTNTENYIQKFIKE